MAIKSKHIQDDTNIEAAISGSCSTRKNTKLHGTLIFLDTILSRVFMYVIMLFQCTSTCPGQQFNHALLHLFQITKKIFVLAIRVRLSPYIMY